MKIAIYPGSFDPVTNGHFDIIKRAAKLFDKLVVVVMVNKSKQASFSIDERVEMLRRVTEGIPKVEVDSYTGLLAEYARERHACTVVKGLRAVSDYEYEFQMALANRRLNPNLETIFLPARGEYQFLSSSAVKEIARYGGEISYMVPKIIEKDIAERLKIK
ncbi:MAG: pantetheine-phosphate adenylyltransferase [Clostridia bacterium]|nr:pantetheine-phosphate adenylyltransferase [Clostridia bacterium]